MERILIARKQSRSYSLKNRVKSSRFLIMMIIPAIVYYVLFCYVPMYGVLLSFAYYSPRAGILGSVFTNWVGFDNFMKIFELPEFWRAFGNTMLIGSLKIVISFVSAVLVALMINEIRLRFFKKSVQVIVTFPHFLSWVIVASFFLLLFGDNGAINRVIESLGGTKITLMGDKKFFMALVFLSDIWKEAGWSSIIYIATMAGISTDLYEAADIDGATRLQKIWHITLPGIRPTAILLLIMSVGGVLSAGFDQIFNLTSSLHNARVLDSVNIIDTYIYQISFVNHQFNEGVSTAIGLFKSVVGFVFVIVTDRIAKLCGERGII